VVNVCPFRKGGEFTNSQEKDTYFQFVKGVVERYDGDNDIGCIQDSPDCYNQGDNDYPNQELIERFEKNPIRYWQVCNQLFDICEGRECMDTYAQKFAEVQKITYQAVKEADSKAYVLIAGDSANDLYSEVFQHLNGNYIDIIDLHRFGTEDEYDPKEDFDYLKGTLEDSGFDLSKIKFWITETGTYSGHPVNDKREFFYQSEKQQARGLLKRYVSALSYGIKKVFWAWNIMEGFGCDCCIFDYTGLIYDGNQERNADNCDANDPYDKGKGVKKLSYYTYKKMVDILEGSDWNNIETIQESGGIYIYRFKKDGKNIYVAWNDNSASKSATLSGISSSKIKITEAVPKYESGDQVTDYSHAFNTETKTVSDGKVSITLEDVPVFVEEK
jgi:hypothetical protein